MASWKNITDYALVDFGSFVSSAFWYWHLDDTLGSAHRRVCYLNFPVPIRLRYPVNGDQKSTHLLRILSAAAKNVSVNAIYSASPQTGTGQITARYYVELFDAKLNLPAIDASNNPDGTGLQLGYVDAISVHIANRPDFSFNHAGGVITAASGNRIIWMAPTWPQANDTTYWSARIGLDCVIDTYLIQQYATTVEITSTGLEQLGTRIDWDK